MHPVWQGLWREESPDVPGGVQGLHEPGTKGRREMSTEHGPKLTGRLRGVACAVIVVGLAVGATVRGSTLGYESPFSRAKLDRQYEPYGYVAHALGTIDNLGYTNSLEAFERSYALGFRVFEADFVLLGDGSVLVAHDRFERLYGLSKLFETATAAEVSPKFRGKYTVLFEKDILRIVDEHPDMYLILDTKSKALETHFKIVERIVSVGKQFYPKALERLIPHMRAQDDLDRLRTIYPFNDVMMALYRTPASNEQVVDFVRKNRIPAVMMWWDSRYDPEFDRQLREAGAVTFVHSLGKARRGKIAEFRARGVGVYSNGVFLSGAPAR